MNWTNIDFPKKITPTIKIEGLTGEGFFVVKYLGTSGGYNTIIWHPFRSEEKYNGYTTRVLLAVKKRLIKNIKIVSIFSIMHTRLSSMNRENFKAG